MKNSTTIPHAPQLINEFILLRNNLQQKFLQSFSHIQDLQYLSDCPRQGAIEIERQKWYFQRHGIGISFTEEKSGKTIDIHQGICSQQDKLDYWELVQYFDSIDVKYIEFNNDIFDVNNEENIAILIEALSK